MSKSVLRVKESKHKSKPQDNFIKEKQNPKEELLNQFIQKTKVSNTKEAKNEKPSNNKDYKNELKKIQKKLDTTNKTKQELGQENKTIREENKKLKSDKLNLLEEIKHLKFEFDSKLNSLTFPLQRENLELKKEIDKLNLDLEDATKYDFKCKYYNAKALNMRKDEIIQDLIKKLKWARDERNAQGLYETNQHLEHINRSLSSELKMYKKNFGDLDIVSLFDLLYRNISPANIDIYEQKIEKLITLFTNKRNEFTNQNTEDIFVEEIGFINQTDENEWEFKTVDNFSFPISNIADNFTDGDPVKAFIYNNEAMITKVYTILSKGESKIKLNFKKHVKNVAEDDHIHTQYNLRVLIVGSRNQEKYTEILEKHGIKVEWHNPFEEKYELIDGKFNRADVVLVCKRHIDHSILDHLNLKRAKVEMLDRDNAEIILARTRFAAIRLGLIKFDEGENRIVSEVEKNEFDKNLMLER